MGKCGWLGQCKTTWSGGDSMGGGGQLGKSGGQSGQGEDSMGKCGWLELCRTTCQEETAWAEGVS